MRSECSTYLFIAFLPSNVHRKYRVAAVRLSNMASMVSQMDTMWHGLPGTWQLTRSLHSMNAAEPSGNCRGTAEFTPRQPAIFVDEDGKFQNASREMLYSEQGEFEMIGNASGGTTKPPKFTFSRKYVWRLQDRQDSSPEISIWFVKPGTDKIDYLFHKFVVQSTKEDADSTNVVECSGGHLCVEDYYSSEYTFRLTSTDDKNTQESRLASWKMLHEVRGPNKDQVITTDFERG